MKQQSNILIYFGLVVLVMLLWFVKSNPLQNDWWEILIESFIYYMISLFISVALCRHFYPIWDQEGD